MSLTPARSRVWLGRRTIGSALVVLLAVTLSVQPPTVSRSAPVSPTVFVKGSIPYTPDPSETAVTQSSASCSRIYKGLDLGLYLSELAAFKADHAPDAANLLAHWLAGSGQPVNYGSSSVLATKAAEFPAFQAMNAKVQGYVWHKIAQGVTNITVPSNPGYLPTNQRPVVLMDFNDVVNFPALYWAFRATQGISLTGTIRDQGGRYTGKLTPTRR